jgi:nitrite reductase/ring-hydroxylating ferredoxin subunit
MKKIFAISLLLLLLCCHKDNVVSNNQYLQNISFVKDINTSLPSYNSLQFPSNPVLITDAGAGIQGIIVMKVGDNDYRAWEASCPNQYPTTCSRLTINGINAKCSCDSFEYSLFTGDGGKAYGLKSYRVEVNGTIIRVYN